MGVWRCKLELHLIYLNNMLLILYYFVDHGFVDDGCKEENAFKYGYIHLQDNNIRFIIYG